MAFWSKDFMVAGNHVPMPSNLLIEITSHCNLRCIMCPKTNKSVNTEENQTMSWELFEKITPLFPSLEAIDLTGIWGEAFLHPDLYIKMLKRAKQDNLSVHTTSNGTLLTDDLARQLVEVWLDRLIVSVDAATPETYAKIRPPGSHEKVIAGLISVQKWKKELGSPYPRIDFAFVGMRSNIREFPDVVALAAELGIEQVTLQAMGEFPGCAGESIAAGEKGLGKEMYERAKKIGDDKGVRVELFPTDQFEPSRADHNRVDDFEKHRKTCRDPWNRAIVTANGDILPCCASKTPFGNLNDNTFKEIWHGERFSTLRRSILSNSPPQMCRDCTGISWVDKEHARDEEYFRNLFKYHITKKVKDHLRQYAVLRWIKRGVIDKLKR